MQKVKFIQSVTKPAHRAGEPGDVKELHDHDARELVAGGYCEAAEPKIRVKKVKPNDDAT